MELAAWKAYIAETYGADEEYLWQRYPNYCVFRRTDNKKWFALIADVPKAKLRLDGEGIVNVLDVKLDPILVDSLKCSVGFLPAYHMNKATWITALLDGTVPDEQIKILLDMSFEITAPNTKNGRKKQ